MEVDLLLPVEEIESAELDRPMFNVLKATIEYPASPEVKGVKLADDIRFFCNSTEDGNEADELLWDVWAMLLEIASCAPPEHPWQTSLVRAVNHLRQQGGSLWGDDKTSVWADLPHLSECIREKWDDPTETGEELPKEFLKWKSWTSFVAGLTSLDFSPAFIIPVGQLRHALEEPPIRGSAMECRLWVACEWIIRCTDVIYVLMTDKDELVESAARALRTGSICSEIPPQSAERWRYWKKRLAEIAANAEELGLDSTITKRMSDALARMEAVES